MLTPVPTAPRQIDRPVMTMQASETPGSNQASMVHIVPLHKTFFCTARQLGVQRIHLRRAARSGLDEDEGLVAAGYTRPSPAIDAVPRTSRLSITGKCLTVGDLLPTSCRYWQADSACRWPILAPWPTAKPNV